MTRSDNSTKKLTAEDIEIWLRIANTANPLSKDDKNFANLLNSEQPATTKISAPLSESKNQKPRTGVTPSYQPPMQTKPVSAPQEVDQKTIKNISKGKMPIDGRLDLHGFSQREAYRALYDSVEDAYYSGKRTLLVITGKGNMGRGVLRENVPLWLAQAPFHPLISAFSQSHLTHGGSGALYVRIKRKP
ncbi:MAG: Smr/MutS family protein [Rhizobiaceae bacterium]|nr:Smr/MutS family protein [Rhizobiaceae bacterium]